MCGIVGVIGRKDTKEILLNGLEKLEYRGYDSAGIALLSGSGATVTKVKGRIAALREKTAGKNAGTLGIGHTRWATHGVPSESNAHPQMSQSGRFILVHNGVIENYGQLKRDYLEGAVFESDTDTEVIVQLVEHFYREIQDVKRAFRKTVRLLQGSYALAMLDCEDEETLYVAKNKSPLLIGAGADFHVVTSDAMATYNETDCYMEIRDKEIVFLKKDKAWIEDWNGNVMNRDTFTVELDPGDMEKGTYPHYMLKEIDEQQTVLRRIIATYQGEDGRTAIDSAIRGKMQEADRVYLIAAGTSYHAGLAGKSFIEKLAGIPAEVHIASEFNYQPPLLSRRPLFIFISQSGETADSRAVLVQVKKMGFPAITITNVAGSTLSREADETLLLHAGPEIAVASTKAYTAQLAVLAILAADTAETKGLPLEFDLFQELALAANAIETVVSQKEKIEKLAADYLETARNAFFIGRSFDYYVALEAALKLKEISYIQAEGFAGGELKHGTIALIEEGTPVIALVTQRNVNYPIRGNIQEVAARGANVLTISMSGLEEADDALVLPEVHELFAPLVSVVPLQLFAYYAALHRGCDDGGIAL
jgi:glucosamine--fructose-6-phosphate aminotransferase (isomerizing)